MFPPRPSCSELIFDHICVHSAIWLHKTDLRFWDGAVVGEIQGRAGLARKKGDPPKKHRQVNLSEQMD